jgi:hypothetical protein
MTVLLSDVALVGAFAFVAACCAGLVLAMYRVSARALPAASAGMRETRQQERGQQETRQEETRQQESGMQATPPQAGDARPGGH